MKKPTYYEIYTGHNKQNISDFYSDAKTKQEALRIAKELIEHGQCNFAEVVEANVLYTIHATGAKVIEHK